MDEDVPSAAREVTVAVVALVVVGLVAGGWALGFKLGNAHNGLLALSFTAVGLYVIRMRRGHREAMLFVAVGVVHAVMFFGRQYGAHSGPLPGAGWIGWIGVWPLSLAIALAGWTVMAFPDGRVLSGRWRVAVGGMLALGVVLSLTSALWPVEYRHSALVASHPLSVPGAGRAQAFWDRAQYSFLLFQILWTAAVVVRMRRARGDEGRQLRWLVYAVVVDIALLVGGLVLVGSPTPGLLALPLLPLAGGLAILKYRLYDIDPVINKTIVVSAMVTVITGVYVAVVLGIGALVPEGRGLLWLLTTAVVAVAGDPLRLRMQRVADRLVYGHRTSPYEALAQLTAHAHAEPEEPLSGVATTVANAVGAREVVVWVGDEERLVPAAAWPTPIEDTAHPFHELARPRWLLRPVLHHGNIVGALTLYKPAGETLTVSEDRLLSDLVAHTALVVVQQRQAEQLRSAARRIVTAGDAARRRIERDLHDGAQQQLLSVGLELGVLAERAAGDPSLAEQVRHVRGQLLDATAELRDLARGLHPTVLTEQGLRAALESLADRSSLPVKLSVALDDRLSREIEATAYFLVSEALANATRHADARLVRVSIAKVDGHLRVEVADDGCGGATRRDGGGLQGVTDRLAALGAPLHLDSPVGRGTRISTVLPCV